MRMIIISLCIICLTTIIPIRIDAQEWSSEQKEAWEIVQKMYDFWAERNLEGYMSCLHDNFKSNLIHS